MDRINAFLLACFISTAIALVVVVTLPYGSDHLSSPSIQIECDPNCTAKQSEEHKSKEWVITRLVRKSLDDPLTAFTGTLAFATLVLAFYTAVVARATKRSADHIPTVERAYLFGTPTPTILNGMTVTRLRLANIGQTPALLFEGYGCYVTVEPAGPPTYPPYFGNPRIIDAFVPKHENNGQETFFPTGWTSPITEPHFFYGYIKYRDIFREEHTSRFCAQVFPAEERVDIAGPPAWSEWD
jgi:hypothetical protein